MPQPEPVSATSPDLSGSHPLSTTPSAQRPRTLAELRSNGYEPKSIKQEIRANLVDRLQSGRDAFAGIVGFDDSVLPQLESALLAGHDLVMLGERGQGKTRLMRTVAGLLDEWIPVVAGCEINDDPFRPGCRACRRKSRELGDELPIDWLHRDDRYAEKLATPDTSVGDLIGDVDPVKVAEGRTLGDPETVHYGLVPRTHRGLIALNELPDLAERIQVALFNVLEERDIQVRGYSIRLPLDVLVMATANPEDYTNRGRIITPLKDRFGGEIRTHYPSELGDEIALIRQEAELVAVVGDHLTEIIARLTRGLRESSSVDQRSGVSARFPIAACEGVAASALRRSARVGEQQAVARMCDLDQVLPTLAGKIEFEMGEEGREAAVGDHLLRVATAETFRDRLGGVDLSPFTQLFADGSVVETGELVSAQILIDQLGTLPGLSQVLESLDHLETLDHLESLSAFAQLVEHRRDDEDPGPGEVAAAVEFVLEGLHLTKRVDKDVVDGRTVYGS